MKEIIEFTRELKRNNNREWFQDNKKRYESSKKTFLELIQEIINGLTHIDPRLSELEAKNCLFRIYRDVRFSKDKVPYKTHFGAYMAKGGRKSTDAGYYIQISDNEFFIGGGVYMPPKEELKAIRQEILYQADKFKDLVKKSELNKFKLYEEDKLKNGPKDFPKDSPHIELLKYKHFMLTKNIKEEDVLSENIASIVISEFQKISPFTEFLNTAIDFKGNE